MRTNPGATNSARKMGQRTDVWRMTEISGTGNQVSRQES